MVDYIKSFDIDFIKQHIPQYVDAAWLTLL